MGGVWREGAALAAFVLGCFVLRCRLGRRLSWAEVLAVFAASRLLRILFDRRQRRLARASHPGAAPARSAIADSDFVRPGEFERRFVVTSTELPAEVDFIVVGAGSAGCSCARRLALAGASVLLVEAGGEAQRAINVARPDRCMGSGGCAADWCLRSTPQAGLLPRGRVVDLTQGKTLGGSSCLNYLLYVRGAPEDFDRWAQDYGCEGWSYQDVLPNFKALEDATGNPAIPGADPKWRGSGGPLRPAAACATFESVQAWMDACKHLGAVPGGDYNGEKQIGVAAAAQLSIHAETGHRSDAFTTAVEPCLRSCHGLKVVSETLCRKLVLDGSTDSPELRTTGVELELRDGSVVTVRCRHEVVLSGGALNTPKLLLLSGIGDRQDLAKVGVTCKAHVPAVGRNLMDHVLLPTVSKTNLQKDSVGYRDSAIKAYGKPLCAGFWHCQSSVGRARAKRQGTRLGSDLQLGYMPGMQSAFLPAALPSIAGPLFAALTPDLRTSWLYPLHDVLVAFGRGVAAAASHGPIAGIAGILIAMQDPQSRGHVKLGSGDPHEPPIVDPNYLHESEDVDTMVEGLRKALDLLEQPELKSWGGQFAQPLPASDASDKVFREYVRKHASTLYHYAGTARMGPIGDPACVCDSRCRVQAVQGLRVADASLMPCLTSGNTDAPCRMIGDRVGEFLVMEHGFT